MKAKNKNQSSVKTKDAIRKAFGKLVKEKLLDLAHSNETLYRQVLATDSPVYFLLRARREVAAKILAIPDINREPDAWTAMKVEIFVDGLCKQIMYYFRGQHNYSFEEFKEGMLACAREFF